MCDSLCVMSICILYTISMCLLHSRKWLRIIPNIEALLNEHAKFSNFNHMTILGSAESDNTRYLQHRQYKCAVYFSKKTKNERNIKFENQHLRAKMLNF